MLQLLLLTLQLRRGSLALLAGERLHRVRLLLRTGERIMREDRERQALVFELSCTSCM